MCKKWGLLFTILACCQVLYAQKMVTGSITDISGKIISGANIMLRMQRNGAIQSFAISDDAGNYQLKYTLTHTLTDSLFLQVNALGYKKSILPFLPSRTLINFALEPTSDMLPNVTVTNTRSMLKLSGDTLSFNVDAFTSPQDRVIGDIIKKLPGIEMDNDGKIYYQGKPINRFLIDGSNLLDGRYNIATNSVPSDMVEKVQILENHQPIKALKDVSFSENAAVNIVLKDKARLKIIGSGDAATGLPDLYNGSLRLMQFNKKTKLIDYYKLNNTGNDLHRDLINHNLGETDEDNVYPTKILSFQAATPPLNKNRYLFNNSGLANLNQNITVGPSQELKWNAYYLHDRQLLTNSSNTTIYLPNDTIRFFEQQDARLHEQQVSTQLTYESNQTRYYIINKFSLDHTKQQAYGNITGNIGTNISQQLFGNTTQLNNEFRYTGTAKKNGMVMDMYSMLSLIHNPANLEIAPGLHTGLLNNNNPYTSLNQFATVPSFFTHQYLSFKKPGKFRQSYTIGIQYEDKNFASYLNLQQLNGSIHPAADSFQNQLKWKRYTVYAEPKFSWVNNQWVIELATPLSFQATQYQSGLSGNYSNQITPFTPSLSVRREAGSIGSFSLQYRSEFRNGTIKDIYDGYILLSYRNYGANNSSLLPTQQTATTQFAYQFKNISKIFFFNLSAGYTQFKRNIIDQQVLNSILQRSVKVPFENNTHAKNVSAAASKYLFFLHSTLSGKVSWQQLYTYQLQNSNLFRYQNNSTTITGNFNTRFTRWLNTTYAFTASNFLNKVLDQKPGTTNTPQKVSNTKQELNIHIIPEKHWIIKISDEYYTSRLPAMPRNQFNFIDLTATYKWDKLRTDIDLSVTNIANEKKYVNLIASANSIAERSYSIRPRMILVKFLFRF